MPITFSISAIEFLLRFFRTRRITSPFSFPTPKWAFLIICSVFAFISSLFFGGGCLSSLVLLLLHVVAIFFPVFFFPGMTSGLSRGLGNGSGNSTRLLVTSEDPDKSSCDRHVDYVEECPKGRFVRYKEVLGRGAFKTVYKAFDQLEGIEVAWNRVKTDEMLQSSEEDLQQKKLYSEVQLLKHLKHENIMILYDSWIDEEKKTFNMITELFTSGSLRQYRKKHKSVDIKAIKKWARQILKGLDHLHSQNPPIIHRDLKCDNIFVNGNQGQIKIGDLGLATIRHQQFAKSVHGTPEFMAPEIYKEEYNELVDIYSFGLCLLEMVTLEYPYSECNNQAQIYRKVTLGIKPASLGKVTSSEVKEFIEKCLLPASERFSARELLKDPFLQYANSKAPSRDEVQIPIEVPRFLSPTDCDNHYTDTDHEYSQFACTDSNSGSPRSSVLEFQRVHQNNEFRLKGVQNEDNSFSFTLRIADQCGQVKNISFPFYPASETAVVVASEMVKELDLADHDVAFIANFIDFLIMKMLPNWKPSSEYRCTEERSESYLSLIPDQGETQTNDSQDDSQYCFMSPYETFSSSPCMTSYGNLSQGSMSYEAMRVDSSTKNKMHKGSNGEVSEFDFSDLLHENCRVYSTDQLSEDSGSVINRAFKLGSETSFPSSLNLQESDSLSELKFEIDAIKAQYQQRMQELSRMRVEELEATKRRWMTKKKVIVH